MKTLVVAPQPFFSFRGTPFSVYYRTLISSELGMEIDLLTYGQGQDVDIPNVKIIRIPRFKGLGNVKIGPSALKLFLDIFIAIQMVWLLCKNHYDVVHAHEEAIFIAFWLKPIFRFKLIYDMHSSLPQQLTNFQFTTSTLLIQTFKALEKRCLKVADGVITICPELQNYALEVIDNPKKHVLIENSIFETVRLASQKTTSGMHTSPPSLPKLPELPELQDKKLAVYAGTLEAYQGIDILLSAFRVLIDQEPLAFLLVVGGTSEQVAHYQDQAHQLGLKAYVTFTGQLPQVHAKHFNKMADVLLSPRSHGTNTPLKVYEQLASGTPLVATNITSHTQVLTDDVCFLVDPDPQDMARGIRAALRNDDEVHQRVAMAQQLYAEMYSRDAYKRKLQQLLELIA